MTDLIENDKYCDLIPPEETKVINPYKFGDTPISDQCSDIEIECTLDEFQSVNSTTTTKKWFYSDKNTPPFYIKKTPIEFDYDSINSGSIPLEEIVPVEMKNVVPTDWLPTNVSLRLEYYQIS